jgi:hypothetical protein
MFVLKRLTDLPMRRLYRYILRKTIGTYLLGELTVDQLDVQISEGEVNLLNLNVRAAKFTPLFPGMFVREWDI